MDLMQDTAQPHIIMVPLELLHDDEHDMRRVAVSARADAALTASIRRRGVLQAIGARPNGNGYHVVFGHRRLRCARAAGLIEIPADVRTWTDGEVLGVQAAENMQREAPHPVDVWQTVRDLVDAGYAIADAAEECGLDDRQTRQMERLGRLHPELLALIEIEMPGDAHLAMIANAPAEVQAVAAQALAVTDGPGGRRIVRWHEIAARCRVERIPQSHAIFDAAAHPALWEEDLFASPDDPERITTTDVAEFMQLQRAALEARIAEQRAQKRRVQLGGYSAAVSGNVTLPKGWRLVSVSPAAKPKRTESIFTTLRPNGSVAEVLAVDVAAQKTSEKEREGRGKAKDAAPVETTATQDDHAGHDVEAEPPVETRQKLPISKEGLAVIAAAKTQALRQSLLTQLQEMPLEQVTALLLLALAADNVHVNMADEDDDDWKERQRRRKFQDIAEALLLPGGRLVWLSAADIRTLAGRALVRFLAVTGPDSRRTGVYSDHSGNAAEWIGAAIDAGAAVGRFDTPEFLFTVTGDELRRVAKAAGVKATGSVTDLRQRLAGNLPDWRPDAAAFGAPGPGT